MRIDEIQIGSSKSKGDSFVSLLYSSFPGHPFSHNKFVLVDEKGTAVAMVSASVDKWLGGDAMINDFVATIPGGGSQGMTIICQLADEHDVDLTLTAYPTDSVAGKKMSLNKLVDWYMKFGFECIDVDLSEISNYDDVDMIRHSK